MLTDKRAKGKNIIIPALFREQNKLYLAFNCDKLLINVAAEDLKWKNWQKPRITFEKELIGFVCKASP